MTSADIEIAVAELFNCRKNIIVPNASWGIGVHECDMLIVDVKSGMAREVEIKVSKSDMKDDLKKWHKHDSYKIKYLYFAIPEALIEVKDLIPEHAGIITVKPFSSTYYTEFKGYYTVHGFRATIVRRPQAREHFINFKQEDLLRLAHLGTMRIWKLKKDLQSQRKGNNNGNDD